MPDEDQIRQRAHALWEEEGCPEGRHEAHWAEACRQLGAGQEATGAPQMPVSDVQGGQLGAASGEAGPLGAPGGAAPRHPGAGASLAEGPPRLGPAPAAPDDARPGLADPGSPHGPSATDRGR